MLFGLITVYIFARKKGNQLFKVFVIAVALLDGIAVFYLNEGDLLPYYKMLFASIHYAIYVIFIILMFGFGRNEKKKKQSDISPILHHEIVNKFHPTSDNEITKLLQSGKSGKEIAKQFKISESKVSRIKKRNSL